MFKCKTCEDKGYIIDPAPWNVTAQECCECPDCDVVVKETPKDLTGLLT